MLYNILFLILVFYFVFFISLPLLSLRAVIFFLVCLAFSCPRKNFVFFSPSSTHFILDLIWAPLALSDPTDFKGVTLDDLVVLEQIFRLNVYVYDLQKTEAGDITARLVRRAPYSFEDTMNLNLYEDHFSYGSDMEKYSHSYPCLKCDRLWKHVGTLYRHERTCTGSVTPFNDVQDIA